jgi:hypothetical protein
MEYLKTIIQKIIPKVISKNIEKPLGRWRIDYCNKKINNKIDLSNEDHCGPCGEYALKIIKVSNSKQRSAPKEKSTHDIKNKV